tara:strand:+ start:1268 stop:3238 length:1971 start_codon:yes stop_codon:yes gene_type:complete
MARKDKGMDFTKGDTKYTFNNEQLESQRNLINDINVGIAAMNAGSTEYNKSLVKQNENFAAILAEKRKIAGTDLLGGEDYQDLVDAVDDLKGGNQDINTIIKKRAKFLEEGKNDVADLYDKELGRLKVQELGNEAMSAADSLTGGMASKAKDAAGAFKAVGGGIAGVVVVGLLAAVALITQFNATQQSIADQFGAIGVTEFRSELATANAEFAKFGLSASEAQQTTSEIANNFGLSVSDSSKLAVNARDVATATGTSLADSGKLLGVFKETQNLTAQQAENLLISTTELAVANDVAPDKVLADVAQNTEFFAKFASDGGENILRAAVQAKKLGLELSDIEKITSGLLDFQSSLVAEQEASVMIGRRLNFQKARELALANDIEGATAAVVEQLGSAEEFNKLNALQRQALADAAGVEVGQLQKIVNKEKEALTLSSALSKQQVDIIPEDAINQTALLIGQLTSLGVTLAEVLGPPLNFVVGVFTTAAEIISYFIGGLTDLVGPIGTVAVALGMMSKKLLLNAILGIWSGLSSVMAIPVVGVPLALALGAGAVSAVYSSLSGAEQVGDLYAGAGPVAITPQGKAYEGSVRDEILMAPNIAGAAGGSRTDTSKLEQKQDKQNNLLTGMLATLDGALSGPKPALARAMGASVGDSVDGMA